MLSLEIFFLHGLIFSASLVVFLSLVWDWKYTEDPGLSFQIIGRQASQPRFLDFVLLIYEIEIEFPTLPVSQNYCEDQMTEMWKHCKLVFVMGRDAH